MSYSRKDSLNEYSRRSIDSRSQDIRNNPYSRRTSEYKDRGRERVVETIQDGRDTRDIRDTRHSTDTRNVRDIRDNRDTRDVRQDVRQDIRQVVRDSRNSRDSRYRPNERHIPSGPRNDYVSTNRYDSHRGIKREHESYRPKQSRHQDQYRPSQSDHYQPTTISPEVELSTIRHKLSQLESTPTLSQVKVIDSRWGVKPNGFEQVSAQRAKLSGLFPLPGFPRPVDFTKLEGLIKDRLNSNDDILVEHSKIDPIDSRDSKTLIILNDLSILDYLKLVEFFNDYLKIIDLKSISDNNIYNKRKTKDDKALVIEFNNSECATIIYCLNEMKLLFNGYKQEHIPRRDDDEKFKLVIVRPREYLVQNTSSGDFPDNPRKISLIVSPNTSIEHIRQELNNIHPIKHMQVLKQKNGDALGLIFLEFKTDTDLLDKQISQNIQLIQQIKQLPFIENAFFSCITPKITDIQNCLIEYNTLLPLVRNEYVSPHSKSKVIQLLNCITLGELIDDSNYKFILEDIKSEALKFGNVVSIRIPRPEHNGDFFLETRRGLGKIFIEFENYDIALKAIIGISGKSYNDRTVLGSFYDYEDYKHGLL